jgi:hypothetical protein
MLKLVKCAGALYVGSVLLSAGAHAGASDPVEVARANTSLFINATTIGRTKCQALAKAGLPTAAAADEVDSCIAKLKDDVDRRFKLLPSALGANSAAMKDARELYTYWLTSLTDVAAKDGETGEAYTSRQSTHDTQLSALRKKLEADVP